MRICGCVPLEPVQVIARLLLEQLKLMSTAPIYELRVSMKQDNCYYNYLIFMNTCIQLQGTIIFVSQD